jgi:hypothetical protein
MFRAERGWSRTSGCNCNWISVLAVRKNAGVGIPGWFIARIKDKGIKQLPRGTFGNQSTIHWWGRGRKTDGVDWRCKLRGKMRGK